ncbi:MAG TPA: hypothetical protein EYP78_03435 [Candidatus Omnitrophica bacterium]|nr:hypothetical protein [Candidatus Omnitrophota bacterium]
MIYGIQASKDIKLSNVSRALGEEIPLIKTENRLSRQINQRDLTRTITERLLKEGKQYIKEGTVLAVDISDISKKYSRKQENLAHVRNGSEKEIKNGYWTIGVIGAEVGGDRVIPLYGELYSQLSADFQSENSMILKAIDSVYEKIGKGIFTIDRGGDRKALLKALLGREAKFLVRLTGKRDLWNKGKKRRGEVIAKKCLCKYRIKVKVKKEGEMLKEKVLHIGWRKVRLTFDKTPLAMVVVKGYGEDPLMLLTNLRVKNEEDSVRILEIYLTRWKCEESWRFIKQSYNLEDVRLLRYTGLRNVVPLVMAVFFFVSVVLGTATRLRILLKKVYEKAKRFFEIPSFKQYAICDGIHNILWGRKFSEIKPQIPENPQLILPFEIISP